MEIKIVKKAGTQEVMGFFEGNTHDESILTWYILNPKKLNPQILFEPSLYIPSGERKIVMVDSAIELEFNIEDVEVIELVGGEKIGLATAS